MYQRLDTVRYTAACTGTGQPAVTELAPMRAILFATRDIKLGEEIYYNYGSEKPFEKMKKEAQRKQAELQRREREVCRSVWVPHIQGAHVEPTGRATTGDSL